MKGLLLNAACLDKRVNAVTLGDVLSCKMRFYQQNCKLKFLTRTIKISLNHKAIVLQPILSVYAITRGIAHQ